MKKTILLITVAILFGFILNQRAHAVDIPGWERPILRSEMKIMEGEGSVGNAQSVELTLTKKDMVKVPTGLILDLDGQKFVHTINSVQLDECGSTVYSAEVRIPYENRKISHIYLTDHQNRLCEDYRPNRWELEIMMDGLGEGLAVGDPEVVYTIMNQF